MGSNLLLYLITTVHVIVCIFMVIVILLQSGKGADIAGTFTGMGSQTAFGPRGAASALSKATTAAVILFMFTSLSLSIISSKRNSGGGSVLQNYKPAQTGTKPATPAPAQSAPAQQTPAPAQQPK